MIVVEKTFGVIHRGRDGGYWTDGGEKDGGCGRP